MQNQRFTTCLLTALALPCLPLSAATWTGASDGWSWSNPENWEDGLLPTGGETTWIRPVAGGGWVEIGGSTDGGAINLVIDSPGDLNLMLNPEARVAGVTTLGPGWHRLEGTPPEAMSTWQVDAGGSITLDRLAEGATLVKTGYGTLTVGYNASTAGLLRVTGLEGSVFIEAEHSLDLADATLEALGASFGFAGGATRVGKLVIGEGSFSPLVEGRLVADEVVINKAGELDLGNLPGITAGVLRIEGGSVYLGSAVEANRIVVSNAILGLGPLSLGGLTELAGGWLGGGVLTGNLVVDAAAGMSGWMDTASVAAGGKLTWVPVEDETAALWVMGDLSFDPGSLVTIGKADWSSPYWDTTRTFAFINTWGEGIVRGMPTLEGGVIAGEGSWGVGADGQGGLALTWTADTVPVPEASTLGWAAALALAGTALRRCASGRRPALAADREASAREAATHTGDNPRPIGVGHPGSRGEAEALGEEAGGDAAVRNLGTMEDGLEMHGFPERAALNVGFLEGEADALAVGAGEGGVDGETCKPASGGAPRCLGL